MRYDTRADDSVDREERLTTLSQLEAWLERPMQLLGLAWLILLLVELIRGLSPVLTAVTYVIWAIFVADFLLRLVLAPEKTAYLRRNWLVAVSLIVPAFRVLRFARAFRAVRAVRGLRLVRIVGSVNRGINSLRRGMGRRGLGYVAGASGLVVLAGAAGMLTFERGVPGAAGFEDFPSSLWWTAMLMTTLGSDVWPRTAEGRVLCFLLALYSFAVWGYITASLATYFIGRDADRDDAELAGQKSIALLRSDISSLRAEVRLLRDGPG